LSDFEIESLSDWKPCLLFQSQHRPITHSLNLFHFFMAGVLTATAAEFLELQPLGRRLAVLCGRIVPLFAITAL
jgi:hypothetical protein